MLDTYERRKLVAHRMAPLSPWHFRPRKAWRAEIRLLAGLCGVSVRTIQRDVRAIAEAGRRELHRREHAQRLDETLHGIAEEEGADVRDVAEELADLLPPDFEPPLPLPLEDFELPPDPLDDGG